MKWKKSVKEERDTALRTYGDLRGSAKRFTKNVDSTFQMSSRVMWPQMICSLKKEACFQKGVIHKITAKFVKSFYFSATI